MSWAGPWESLDNLIPLQRGRARRGKATCQESQRVSSRTKAKPLRSSAQPVPSPTPQLLHGFHCDYANIWSVVLFRSNNSLQRKSPDNSGNVNQYVEASPLVCPIYKLLSEGGKQPLLPLVVKNLSANVGDVKDVGSMPELGRSPGERNGNPLQYSWLENPMDRGAWWATVHRVAKSWTPL